VTEYALTDADGTVRWRGTISPAPGGGSQPESEYLTSGGSVTVAVGGPDGALKFAHDNSGPASALLDYSDHQAPTVIESGCYAITVEANPDNGAAAGGTYTLTLAVAGAITTATTVPLAGSVVPCATCTLVVVMTAGDAIRALLANNVDPSSSLAFSLSAGCVTKLS
jgi:hypothetical protein